MLKEEMTIEEAIRRIDEHNYIHQSKEPRAVHITEAFNTLIEVAKKYQKIKEIVGNYGFDTSWVCLKKIREVIENGNKLIL